MNGVGAEISGNAGMWITFAVIVAALTLYAIDRIPLVLSSLGILATLMVIYHVFPVTDARGENLLGPDVLLAGFANTALITILALLVLGEGLSQTGMLDRAAGWFFKVGRGNRAVAPVLTLVFVLIVSGFLNNTPVVVIFIPIIQVLAGQLDVPSSRWMMSLSFASILGGMVTLIGSSTNLLVAGLMRDLGQQPIGFFDFTIPGLVVAGVGVLYVVFVAPRLTPERHRPDIAEVTSGGRQFVAQIIVAKGSNFDGLTSRGGFFPDLKDLTIRTIRRGRQTLHPPFAANLELREGDQLTVAATRKALIDSLGSDAKRLIPDPDTGEIELSDSKPAGDGGKEQIIAEAMVRPSSRLIGQTLEMIGFRHRTHLMVLGIQRRAHVISQQLSDFRLAAGDVLLLQGQRREIDALRGDVDLLLMEWSASALPTVHHARRAGFIFLGVICAAASGLVPIVTAAVVGAALMIATGVLNVRRAARAIDRTIVMLIATALALGTALQVTGGDRFLAELFLKISGNTSPAIALSMFFIFVAVVTNVISNQATAVLFTPIAISVAHGLGVSPEPFAIAVIFGANCSFATPIAYQTNLLVMGPGHYKFLDFVRTGTPLVIVAWIAFSLFAPFYYGL